jgi:hypothetical protein
MKLTNKLGLPSSIVSAVQNDPYHAGAADISVTRLINPPYQIQLLKGHGSKIVEDVSDRIHALMGQIGHSIIERATIDPATSVAEQRIFMPASYVGLDLPDYVVSGAFDLLENNVILDFKFTTVYSSGGKIEWEQQLNMLRVLCQYHYEQKGDSRFTVAGARIIAIYRDWQKAKRFSADYPQQQVESIPVPLWPLEDAKKWMAERIQLHTAAQPPVCTDEERWTRPAVTALMKAGRKSAVKLFRNDAEGAQAALEKAGKGHTLVERPATYTRCESYCSASEFCPAWNELKASAPF